MFALSVYFIFVLSCNEVYLHDCSRLFVRSQEIKKSNEKNMFLIDDI